MRRDKTATYVFSSFVVAGALFFIIGCVIGASGRLTTRI